MLNGVNTVALTICGYPMLVIAPFKSDRRIGSFFGVEHNAAMNRSLVGLIMGLLDMPPL